MSLLVRLFVVLSSITPLISGCASTAPVSVGATTSSSKTLDADTPSTTVLGNTFIAPAGWTLSVRGNATLLEPPEQGSSFIGIVDVTANDAAAAVKAAWALCKPDANWPLKVITPAAS